MQMPQAGQPMDLHRIWDGVITSSSNLTRLRNEATALRNRQEFQRSQLTELASTGLSRGQGELRDCDEDRLPYRGTDWNFEGRGLWTARWRLRPRASCWLRRYGQSDC
jgi:hypothetical protein